MLETVLELAPVQISLYVNSKNTVSDSPLFHTSSYEPYLDLLVHFIPFICFLVIYLIPGCVLNAKYRIHDENRRRAIENKVVLISDAFGHLRTRKVFLKQRIISMIHIIVLWLNLRSLQYGRKSYLQQIQFKTNDYQRTNKCYLPFENKTT